MTTTRAPVVSDSVAVVVRVIALAVLHVGYLALLSRSDSTDALGAGLLFFLIVFVVALAWAGADALRHGFAAALVRWAVTSVLAGLALTLVFVATTADADLGAELTGSTIFFAFLVFVPALIGAAAGGAVHRVRRPAASV